MRDLRRCFDGRIPAVIATASAAGVPNVTYLSAVHPVDDERVALSNQFMSKTSRNLAENPRATLLLLDPVTYSEYRLTLRYERTDRRGPVFERLRDEVDKVAAMSGMKDVFRLRSADICRVESIDLVVDQEPSAGEGSTRHRAVMLAASAELAGRMSRCADLETLLDVALEGMEQLLGYRHSSVMLVDEDGTRLYTVASHGFPVGGVGSEVEVGEGAPGQAAARCAPVREGSLRQMRKYSQTVRRSFEEDGSVGPGLDVPVPSLEDAQSRLAVPAMVRGELVGVVVVDSPLPVAFDDDDESVLTLVATLIAQMVDFDRQSAADDTSAAAPASAAPADRPPTPAPASAPAVGDECHVRFFAEDGSVFVEGEYLIRGVAGRILWSLVNRYTQTGQTEFTNKELRLDKSLELPGFRDNLDTRLLMLKRRLDEREAPLRLSRCGRGRVAMHCPRALRLEAHP
jgi:predicted pyridoxine 5'-phosphate oxidase superfamily flavin-nucleotide-binding protein